MFKFLKNTTNSSNPFLRSQVLLYIVLFISIFNILNLASHKEFGFILLFLLIGYLTSFYSKNMNVIMLTAIALTNAVRITKKTYIKEGLENKESAGAEVDASEKITDTGSKEKDKDGPSLNKVNDVISGISKSLNISGLTDVGSLQDKANSLIATQDKLMKNMNALEPLLAKAEGFLQKYEGMKNKLEGMKNLKTELEEMKTKAEGFRSYSMR